MKQRLIYCVVPAQLAERVHDPLRRHFAEDPRVEVVVEQRGDERRSGAERRARDTGRRTGERRKVRSESGRRVADRRSPVLEIAPADIPALPLRLRRHADRLAFIERVVPSGEAAEDADTARLVLRIQAGEKDLFSELYTRYFDRVYGYLRVLLRNQHDAEDIAQHVFVQVLESIHRYERRGQPFRSWLFVIARNQAVQHLRKNGRVTPETAAAIDSHRERAVDGDAAASALTWVSDVDLLVLIERLPEAQQNVLALKFMLGLTTAEIAKVLDRSDTSVRMLQSRALRFLRARLTALGYAPSHGERARMWRWPKQARVLRARRFSLTAPGPTR
jgi:RNA polymerase sigma-70 factor (ECF subfamily)